MFYTRGLSPRIKLRFLLLPRFFWAGLRPRLVHTAIGPIFFWAGLVVKPSFFFFPFVFLTHFEPYLSESPITLHILFHSRSLRSVAVTVAVHLRSHPWSRTLDLSISDLTVAVHLLPSPLVSNSRSVHLRSHHRRPSIAVTLGLELSPHAPSPI